MNLVALEKQGRPGRVRGYLSMQKFPEDASLCPVAALVAYVDQVQIGFFILVTLNCLF